MNGQGKRAGFWEYAGSIGQGGSCDPCTMPMEGLTQLQTNLESLGVFWNTQRSQSCDGDTLACALHG
jgi:hypothetical protein